jgi:hypothetical protein
VFLGTVTQLDAPTSGFKTAKMHIDHAFKGKLDETEELFDAGICDGPGLEIGRQYLMYRRWRSATSFLTDSPDGCLFSMAGNINRRAGDDAIGR